MPLETASEGLRKFLWQELQNDSNATLRTAQLHLQELCDEAPGDARPPQQHWQVEMDELLQQHEEHTSIADLFSKKGTP